MAAVKLHRKTIEVHCFLILATAQNQCMTMKQKMIIIRVISSTEIDDKAPIINILDILAKTTIEENGKDDDRNKMFVLFDSILH